MADESTVFDLESIMESQDVADLYKACGRGFVTVSHSETIDGKKTTSTTTVAPEATDYYGKSGYKLTIIDDGVATSYVVLQSALAVVDGGVLSIANGGTGATTAADALASLGAMGANSTVTNAAITAAPQNNQHINIYATETSTGNRYGLVVADSYIGLWSSDDNNWVWRNFTTGEGTFTLGTGVSRYSTSDTIVPGWRRSGGWVQLVGRIKTTAANAIVGSVSSICADLPTAGNRNFACYGQTVSGNATTANVYINSAGNVVVGLAYGLVDLSGVMFRAK